MRELASRCDALLRGFRRRIFLLFAEQMICRGLLAAALLASVLTLIGLFLGHYASPTLLWLLFALGAVAGVVVAYLRKPSAMAVAATIERRHPLYDRVTTAVALGEAAGDAAEFRELVTADAVAQLASLSPSALFPHRFTRFHRLAAGGWALALLLFFAPSMPWLYSPAQRADLAQMQQAGAEIINLAATLRKQPVFRKHPADLREMHKLGEALEHNRLSRREAMKRLDALTGKMEDQARAAALKSQAAAKANGQQDSGKSAGEEAEAGTKDNAAAAKDAEESGNGVERAGNRARHLERTRGTRRGKYAGLYRQQGQQQHLHGRQHEQQGQQRAKCREERQQWRERSAGHREKWRREKR